MRVEVVALVLVLPLLAGCASQDGDAKAPSENGLVLPGDVDPDSDFGVVQGSVLSEEQIPLAGAHVGLRGTGLERVTDESGVFVFRDVLPGAYALDVAALGYRADSRPLDVTRAEITAVTVVLGAVENTSAAYYEIIPNTGFFDCALATAAWISACSYPYTMLVGGGKNGTCYFGPCVPGTGADATQYGAPRDVQNNVHRFNISIRQNVGQLQAELAWTPSSAAAGTMSLMIVCGDYDNIADDCVIGLRYGYANGVKGTSPVKHVVEREDWEDADGSHKGFYTADANGTKWDLEENPEIWIMNYVGLPFGCLPLDPLTGSPVTECAAGLPNSEAQVAFAQRFDVWDTVFYNGRGPDDWTVLTDA